MKRKIVTFLLDCPGIDSPRARLLGLWAFWIFVASTASGCAVTPLGVINKKYHQVLHQRHNNYLLKAGDVIRLETRQEDRLLNQTEILILPDGKTDLFYLHDYKAEGKSISEFEKELKSVVAPHIALDDVRIQVQPSGEFVQMVGEFVVPSAVARNVPLTVKMTLQEAVASVGGLKITGDTDWALLVRPYHDPIHPELFRIDLNSLEEDIYLLPRDRVLLGRNTWGAIVHFLQQMIFGIVPPNLTSFGALAF